MCCHVLERGWSDWRSFEYFYGPQSEQFSFYRIPKLLFADEAFENLSIQAVVLYGMLLDRMSLSAKNGWLDDENRVYVVFSIAEIMEKFRCANKKAGQFLSELEDAGLIVKKRRGQGKTNLIYVKNFINIAF